MVLPEELQRSFEEKLGKYQEEKQMPLLSRMELRAMQKGVEQGLQQGLQQGILQNAREAVLAVLEMRFAEVSPELIEVINGIEDVAMLKPLLKQAIAIPSIEDFQEVLEQALISEGDLAAES